MFLPEDAHGIRIAWRDRTGKRNTGYLPGFLSLDSNTCRCLVSREPEFLTDLLDAERLTVNFVDEKKRRLSQDLGASVHLTPELELEDIWRGLLAKYGSPYPERLISFLLPRLVEVAVGIEFRLVEPESGPNS